MQAWFGKPNAPLAVSELRWWFGAYYLHAPGEAPKTYAKGACASKQSFCTYAECSTPTPQSLKYQNCTSAPAGWMGAQLQLENRKVSTCAREANVGSPGIKITFVEVRILPCARTGLRIQNARRAFSNAYPKTVEQTEGRRTHATSVILSKLELCVVLKMPVREGYPKGDRTAYAQKPTQADAPKQDCLAHSTQFPFCINPVICKKPLLTC